LPVYAANPEISLGDVYQDIQDTLLAFLTVELAAESDLRLQARERLSG